MRVMGTVMAMTWAMVTVMRVASNKKGNGKGSKGEDDANDGGGQQRG